MGTGWLRPMGRSSPTATPPTTGPWWAHTSTGRSSRRRGSEGCRSRSWFDFRIRCDGRWLQGSHGSNRACGLAEGSTAPPDGCQSGCRCARDAFPRPPTLRRNYRRTSRYNDSRPHGPRWLVLARDGGQVHAHKRGRDAHIASEMDRLAATSSPFASKAKRKDKSLSNNPLSTSDFGRAGGDRTHDPRIMSPLL